MERKLPPRRLNPLGAAVAATSVQAALAAAPAAQGEAAAVPTLDEQIRLARMKLELKPAARDLNRQLLANVDSKLQEAVERFMGFKVTDPKQVAGRLTHQDAPEGRTFYVDGVAVLFVGPADISVEGTVLHAQQEVRQLLPEDFKPAAAGGIIVL